MSANAVAYYKSIERRLKEMRRNMEGLKQDLADAGIDDVSFDEWEKAFDRQEEHLQSKIQQAGCTP